MSIERLEQELHALAAHIDFPQTPEFSTNSSWLSLRPLSRPRRRVRRLAIAFAIVLATAAASYGASSRLRDTIRDWLGANAVEINRVATLPPLPLAPPGTRPSLGSADSVLGQPLLLPSGLGKPSAVLVVGRSAKAAVTLTWRPRPGLPEVRRSGLGLVINEVLGSIEEPFARKVVGPGTVVKLFRIDGRPAVGLIGAPHQVAFKGASGDFTIQQTRLAVNTLLVNHGDLLVRIEAGVPLARLVAIDRSLR